MIKLKHFAWLISDAILLIVIIVLYFFPRQAAQPDFIPAASPVPTVARTQWGGYPRLSPFQAIKWNQDKPQVKVHDVWYQWSAINDVPVDKIISFARHRDGGTWQKHINEDLVELLSQMGHPPGASAKLVVKNLDSPTVRVLEDVPMTAANRRAILKADISAH